MNLEKGFQLTDPNKFVPWRITALELEGLFDRKALKKVTKGYYTIDCEPLPGLFCVLGFHLRQFNVLTELEFFRRDYSNQKKSYEEFQERFEAVFGKPSKTAGGSEGYPTHEWDVPGAVIFHYIFDRFGPEEHMRIRIV